MQRAMLKVAELGSGQGPPCLCGAWCPPAPERDATAARPAVTFSRPPSPRANRTPLVSLYVRNNGASLVGAPWRSQPYHRRPATTVRSPGCASPPPSAAAPPCRRPRPQRRDPLEPDRGLAPPLQPGRGRRLPRHGAELPDRGARASGGLRAAGPAPPRPRRGHHLPPATGASRPRPDHHPGPLGRRPRPLRRPALVPRRAGRSLRRMPRPPRHHPGLGEADALRRRRGGRPAPGRTDPADRVLVLLGAHAGLRAQECTDLRWADVHLARRDLLVRRG